MKTKNCLILLFFLTACTLSESKWDKVKKENSRTAYVDYIVKNPQSENLKQAQEKIDSLNWSLFYFLVPNDPSKDRILSKGYFIPKTNMLVEVSTLSMLPQKTCTISELKEKIGEPDTIFVNQNTKYLFVVNNIRKILGIPIKIWLDNDSATYGVNVFPSDIIVPGKEQGDNIVFNSFKGSVARYGNFDLLIDNDKIKQIVINFPHGSLEKSKVDTTNYGGWRLVSNSDAMFFSVYIPRITLINDSDIKKIFAKDELRK
jgi:hypothetical protein